MQPRTLGLIHTSATLIPVFQSLAEKHLPASKLFNIVDDSLVKNIIARGGTPDADIFKRVLDYVQSAQNAGADYILVTCSSIGAAIEAAAKQVSVPVLRVDQPMADIAVSQGKRIGVIATLATTLEPTADLVERRAKRAGKDIELKAVVCEGAFDALMAGDAAKHDFIVAEALKSLAQEVDLILLAQASMARVVDSLSEADKIVPILTSPPSALEYIAKLS